MVGWLFLAGRNPTVAEHFVKRLKTTAHADSRLILAKTARWQGEQYRQTVFTLSQVSLLNGKPVPGCCRRDGVCSTSSGVVSTAM